jgi:hypothetical protein
MAVVTRDIPITRCLALDQGSTFRRVAMITTTLDEQTLSGRVKICKRFWKSDKLIVHGFHQSVDLISFHLPDIFVVHGQLRLAGQEALMLNILSHLYLS